MADKAKAAVQEKKENFLTRVKNPLFIAAVAGFVYTVYGKVAPAQGWPTIEHSDFQLAVDLMAYVLIGSGVYSTFGIKKQS